MLRTNCDGLSFIRSAVTTLSPLSAPHCFAGIALGKKCLGTEEFDVNTGGLAGPKKFKTLA
jgi:hypothetical protein